MFGFGNAPSLEKRISSVLQKNGIAPEHVDAQIIEKDTLTLILKIAPPDMLQAGLEQIKDLKKIRVITTAQKEDKGAKSKPINLALPPLIAVASGKGGVGKSTLAVNLAMALAQTGLRIGLLDADIYGPSIPRMLGVERKKPNQDSNKIIPVTAYGMKVMSIGFLVDPTAPMIWRGPMVQSALRQMLTDVDWSGVDMIIIDMPPGTGDAQLTLAQQTKLAGAVIVSTPQDIALLDARKGLEMFRKTSVPILGIVENMSVFCCPNCGTATHIFGEGGAKREAAAQGVPFLGEVPLDPQTRLLSDTGQPITLADPFGPQAQAYKVIASAMLNELHKGTTQPAPRIVIE